MIDDVLDKLNAERRRQWDERKEPDNAAMDVAVSILDKHDPGSIRVAFEQHLTCAGYGKALNATLRRHENGAWVSYVICHVAAILEPERRKELGV